MHDAELMRLADGLASLEDEVDRFRRRERTACLNELREVDALEILHHDERWCRASSTGDVEDANDVLVLDLRREPRLAQKPFELLLIHPGGRMKHLHRDELVELQVSSAEDNAHTAFTEHTLEEVSLVEDMPDFRSDAVNRHATSV